MKTLEEQLQVAGLQVMGCCERLSAYSADLMQAAPLLQDLNAEEADILGAYMLLVQALPGQVLIREGEVGNWMLLLLKGVLDVSKRIDSPGDADPAVADTAVHTTRLAVLRRGATIGEMSMLDGEPRYASCTAIDAVEVGVLGSREVAMLIRDHPAVGAKLLVKITQLMAQRLRNTSNQLVKLLQKR